MEFDESSATALVRLTGLAFICLNGAAQRCEIGIIRDNKHQLSIKILKPYYGTNNVVQYNEMASYQQLPKENLRLEIKAQGAPIGGYQTYENGDFYRLGANDANDSNDFRWLVDIQDLHGSTLGPTINKRRHPLSKVYLHSALLYTHELDQHLFFDQVTTDANGVASSPQPFGRVAKTMGAQINGAEVSLTIQDGNQTMNHVLPRIPNLQYKIEIKNIDYNLAAVYSDMPDYYKYIASPSGRQVELRPGKEGAKPGVLVAGPRSIQAGLRRQSAEGAKSGVVPGKPVNQENFCHPVVFPLPSLDTLNNE